MRVYLHQTGRGAAQSHWHAMPLANILLFQLRQAKLTLSGHSEQGNAQELQKGCANTLCCFYQKGC